jgi:hypothetical protein
MIPLHEKILTIIFVKLNPSPVQDRPWIKTNPYVNIFLIATSAISKLKN